jgi:dsRNA-specific ribonuclease
VTDWRAHLEGEPARDVEQLDRALGLRLESRVVVDALLDPRGPLFQRLEYVGDAILDMVVVQALVRLQPWTEPSLAMINGEQQALVSDHALSRVAERRELPPVRTFAVSVHRLGDRIEAAIGAAWADSGIGAAVEVATRLVVRPGLHHLPVLGAVPDTTGDDRYETAARVCGHDPLEPAWYGAAATGGAPRRRLANVGNAVLEAALSMAQYVDSPWATEAEMSEERRTATSNAVLAERAVDLGLVRPDDDQDSRAVADEVQALVGAVTLDRGTVDGLDAACSVLGRTSAQGPVTPIL